MPTIVKNLVLKALNDALNELTQMQEAKDERTKNNKRSCVWVETLANAIHKENKLFKRNELLHDITVCAIDEIPSLQRTKNNLVMLPVIRKVIWQVESEFNGNTREIAIDFNKLILGSAENKLFICAERKNEKILLDDILKKLAIHCNGNVYLCLLAHPRNWNPNDNKPDTIKFWAFVGKEWQEVI